MMQRATNTTTFTSMDNLEITFEDCPLTALSEQTVKKLSSFLNIKKIFHSEAGYERDWRGLAVLAEQRSLCDETALHHDNPLSKVLELWCENKPDTATFENLQNFLGLIDRWHILEDIEEDLQEDFRNYQMHILNESAVSYDDNHPALDINNTNTTMAIPTNTRSINNTVALASANLVDNNEVAATSFNLNGESKYNADTKLLTSNDVRRSKQGLPLQQYDAFVLYADADFNYAMEILNKLQFDVEYNLNFCLKDDLLFGILFEHVALMELIKERCTFLIVILTKEFNKSPENKFLVNYTQALQIQSESRKIIPLLYEMNVEVPANLVMYSRMYYNPNRTDYYWSKLADSIQTLTAVTNNNSSKSSLPRELQENLRYTAEALLMAPSAPADMLLGDFIQPPYNPQYNPRSLDYPSSSSSSSNSRNKRPCRNMAIACEEMYDGRNLYPNATDRISNESSRSDSSTTSSSLNGRIKRQSNLYPTIERSSNSPNSSSDSATKRNTNSHTQSLHNYNMTEEEATTSSGRLDKTNSGTKKKLWKKLFKR